MCAPPGAWMTMIDVCVTQNTKPKAQAKAGLRRTADVSATASYISLSVYNTHYRVNTPTIMRA